MKNIIELNKNEIYAVAGAGTVDDVKVWISNHPYITAAIGVSILSSIPLSYYIFAAPVALEAACDWTNKALGEEVVLNLAQFDGILRISTIPTDPL